MSKVKNLLMFILVSVTIINSQQNGNPQQNIPENEIGIIVNEFISVINSADSISVVKFVNKYLKEDLGGIGAEKWSSEDYIELLRNLKTQGGIFSPVNVQKSNSDDYLAVFFQTSNSQKLAGIEFIKNKNRNSLRSLEVHAMQMPSAPYKWPAEKLDADGIAAAIDQKVEKDAEAGLFSGVVLVAKNGKIILQQPYGYADNEKGIYNTNDTRFHTGSVGKMITAVAAAQLVEKGKLRYSDKIGDILPDYPNKAAAAKVTVHDLLTHTSGIADPFELGRRQPDKHYVTPEVNLPLFADAELKMEPGAYHSYSNGNYTVLAAIIEKTSGLSFEQYLQDHIFKPAGMSFGSPGSYSKYPMAVRYSYSKRQDPLALANPVRVAEPKKELQFEYSGYCNGYLTADDLYKFLYALREGVLVSDEMTEIITSGKVSVGENGPAKYAYGFYDMTMWGTNIRGHSGGGSNSGIGADAEMVWNNDYYVIVLGNCDIDKVRPIALSICRFLGQQE
jgi:CubicO group peptidase (beta-lactamase class C family)